MGIAHTCYEKTFWSTKKIDQSRNEVSFGPSGSTAKSLPTKNGPLSYFPAVLSCFQFVLLHLPKKILWNTRWAECQFLQVFTDSLIHRFTMFATVSLPTTALLFDPSDIFCRLPSIAVDCHRVLLRSNIFFSSLLKLARSSALQTLHPWLHRNRGLQASLSIKALQINIWSYSALRPYLWLTWSVISVIKWSSVIKRDPFLLSASSDPRNFR